MHYSLGNIATANRSLKENALSLFAIEQYLGIYLLREIIQQEGFIRYCVAVYRYLIYLGMPNTRKANGKTTQRHHEVAISQICNRRIPGPHLELQSYISHYLTSNRKLHTLHLWTFRYTSFLKSMGTWWYQKQNTIPFCQWSHKPSLEVNKNN